jgi:hypothetical protein
MIALALGSIPSLVACDKLGLGGDEAPDTGKPDDEKDEKDDTSSNKAEAPDPFEGKVFKIDETAELADVDLTVDEIKECRFERDANNQSLARNKQKIVAAHLEAKATAEETRVARSFRAHDHDDVVFSITTLSGTDCQPDLKASRLKAGEKAKGWIGFKVPSDVEGLTMRFEHQPLKPKGAKKNPDKQYPVFSLEK